MDAALFLKEKDRMCKAQPCHTCPLGVFNNGNNFPCGSFEAKYPEETIAVVEKWSKENPFKTKKDKFFEMFPNAPKVSRGYPLGLPCELGWCNAKTCANCRHNNKLRTFCWDLPYEGDD